jgi:2-succinyl-6-hydroxy-2,4-cyclohexadiene-1-carboxylate synthase
MAEWRALAGPLAARVAGRGRRLVFVHGFTQTGSSWRPIADHFADRGHEVVIVDLPGHGGSGTVRADLPRTADLLATTAGEGVYVGYSLGARVCLHLALMHPDLVDRLAVLGVSPGIVDDDERAARRTADETLALRIIDIGVERFIDEWSAQPLFGGHVLTPADRTDRCRNTAAGLASSLGLSGTGTQVPLWDRLHELTMPVLAMAGERDEKFMAIAERVAASAPYGTFGVIHDAAHAAHLQQPTQVITLLEHALHSPARLPIV